MKIVDIIEHKILDKKILQTEDEVITYVSEDLKPYMRKMGVLSSHKNSYPIICSSFFEMVRNSESLLEDTSEESKFLKSFEELDEYENMNIKVGSKVCIMELILSKHFAELFGFKTPKTITKIFREPSENNITQFEFDNNPDDVWPRIDQVSYNGRTITHSAFFPNSKSIEQAIFILTLKRYGEIQIKDYVR